MSGETSAATTDGDLRSIAAFLGAIDRLLPDRQRLRTVAVGSGAVLVAAQLLVAVLYNAPFDPVAVPRPVRAGLAAVTPVTLAAGLIVVGVTARRSSVRVGSLFAGVFGPLAGIDPGATLPAVLGVTVGGALALAGVVGRPTRYVEVRSGVVAAGFGLAVAVSLGSTTGLLAGGNQALGTALTLGTIAATGLLGPNGRSRWSVLLPTLSGLAGFAAVVAAGLTSPYLFGSVLLVGFAAVGVPHLLFALAVAGGLAAAVDAVRRGATRAALGACLLLVTGVPVTLPRAMAVLLGAVVLLSDPTVPGTEAGSEEVKS